MIYLKKLYTASKQVDAFIFTTSVENNDSSINLRKNHPFELSLHVISMIGTSEEIEIILLAKLRGSKPRPRLKRVNAVAVCFVANYFTIREFSGD